MRISSLLRVATVGLLGVHVLVNGLACGGDDDDGAAGSAGSAGSGPVNLDAVVYEGGVTDEAVASMLGVSSQTDDGKAPRVTAPTDGAVIPAGEAFTFTWPASTARLDVPASWPGLAPSLPAAPRLPAWLGPERSAHAHGEPYTGVAYLLTFGTASKPDLLRVATSQTSYTPGAPAWQTLAGAGEAITLTLTVARLEANLLVAAGGPFSSSSGVTFTVQ